MRKIICLLCVLVLLPVTCFAWGSPDGTPMAFDFDFGFEMDPDAFPKEDYRTALGYSELLNRTRISGTWIRSGNWNDCYDITLNIAITDKETANVPLRLFGFRNGLFVESPLLGEERLFMNLDGWLKIALKAYDYFEIPAQEPALLLPYASELGLRGFNERWEKWFPTGKNVALKQKKTLGFTSDLRNLWTDDENFADWINAVRES